jgi:DNA invertase Pin-like site-specific DNA recombinase
MIIIWRLDRYGRSVSDLIGTLREPTDIRVGFVSLTEAGGNAGVVRRI